MNQPTRSSVLLCLLVLLSGAACSSGRQDMDGGSVDNTGSDAGQTDASLDGGTTEDAGDTSDAGEEDGGVIEQDGGPTDGGPTDGGVAMCGLPFRSQACNALEQRSLTVTESLIQSTPPFGAGGVIQTGMYLLTFSQIYTGPSGSTASSGDRYAETLFIRTEGSAVSVEGVISRSGSDDVHVSFEGLMNSGAGRIDSVDFICPDQPTCGGSISYTASLNSLSLIFQQPNGTTLVQSYTYLLGSSDAGPPGDAGLDAGLEDAGPMDAGRDAGMRPDAGVRPDAGPAQVLSCWTPLGGNGCSGPVQAAPTVEEIQVATDPPPTFGGWYPGGRFFLTSATLYTGNGGASGPDGISYAMTMQVSGNGSVDVFDVVKNESGCPETNFSFSGDTFDAFEGLHDVQWMCPLCPTCATTMPYTGTGMLPLPDGGVDSNNGTFLVYFERPDGHILALGFTTNRAP